MATLLLGAASLALLALPAAPARATTYELSSPDQMVVGQDQTVTTVYADTLYDLAAKYRVDSQELIRVNAGIDPWLPGAGKKVLIPGRLILPPGPHVGIIVNLPEHRLYYFPRPRRGHPRVVITYPVSIGKMDWRTPIGLTHVIAKIRNPVWYVPAGVRKEHLEDGDPLPAIVRPGPDDPLGKFALRLAAGGGTYLIHGTNNPIAVGMPVTHGCIRLYPDDVAQLFPLVPVGTPVHIINDPVKVAWVDGELLLEAHPPIDDQGQSLEPDVDEFSDLLRKTVGDNTVAINWEYARDVLKKADGVLATVGLQADLSGAGDSQTPAAPAAPATPAAQAAAAPAPAAPPPASAAPAGAASVATSASASASTSVPVGKPDPALADGRPR
ncbi:MAG TPA: L,D-transpeptidase family protein [Steroidobacteraceae bacterium]|nr:L,D-transpeptidase family protein [Steroidobacteraceae bacterium]